MKFVRTSNSRSAVKYLRRILDHKNPVIRQAAIRGVMAAMEKAR